MKVIVMLVIRIRVVGDSSRGLGGSGVSESRSGCESLHFSFGVLVLVCALFLRFGISGVGGGVEGRGGRVLHLGLKVTVWAHRRVHG